LKDRGGSGNELLVVFVESNIAFDLDHEVQRRCLADALYRGKDLDILFSSSHYRDS
jgi:hypothetical protein